MIWRKLIPLVLTLLVAATLLVLGAPQPLFAHQMTYGRYQVWSDRPIDPPAARRVLDDAEARISASELDTPNQPFRIFVCNDNWKLALYSQRFAGGIGGVADTWFTRNIYLREVDFAANAIVKPGPARATMSDRPLAYYIAHEATHILESRAFGRLVSVAYPAWKNEGYADYVGKGGRFDAAANRRALLAGARELDPQASGLYRRYHLEVAYLLDRKGMTARQLFAAKTTEQDVLSAIKADRGFGAP